jgi:hypothetical protein
MRFYVLARDRGNASARTAEAMDVSAAYFFALIPLRLQTARALIALAIDRDE